MWTYYLIAENLEKEKIFALVMVSIAAMKYHGPKTSWGGKSVLSLHFHIGVVLGFPLL